MVGATGFEPGGLLRPSQTGYLLEVLPLATLLLKRKDLPKKFGGAKKYENVPPHAQGPRIFPIPTLAPLRASKGLTRLSHEE